MVISLAALLALTGCSNSTPGESRAPASRTPAEVHSSAAAPSETPDARTPPQLPDAQRTFIKVGGKKGSSRFPTIPHIRRGTLEIGVICSGSGTIEVHVGSIVGFTNICGDSDPGQFNEVALKEIHNNVAVSVTSRTSASWGLSVGWTKETAPPN